MAWFDSQLPSYLVPHETPADALLKGTEAGRNIVSSFAQGASVGRENAMAPLQQAMAEIQMKEQAANLTATVNAADMKAQNKVGVAKWAETVEDISRRAAWDQPESEGALWGVIKDYPTLAAEPAVRQGLDLVKSSKIAEFRQKQLDAQVDFKTNDLAQREAKLKAETDRWNKDRASKESIAQDNNATKLDVAGLMTEANKYGADRRAESAQALLDAKASGGSQIDSKMRQKAYEAELHQAWSSSITDKKFDERMNAIKKKYKVGDSPPPAQAPAPAAQESGTDQAPDNAPTAAPSAPVEKPVTSKSEFDALPSGSIFLGTDGKKYRKK